MTSVESVLRATLQSHLHDIHPQGGLSPKIVRRAKRERLTIMVGSVAAITLAGVGLTAQIGAESHGIDPAAGPAASSNAIASGTTPDGSKWTLSSAPASQWPTSTAEGFVDQGAHCFGFAAGANDGRSDSCHAAPDDMDRWLHLESARLAKGSPNAGAALYGEVSKRVATIEITLSSGRVLSTDIIAPAESPYAYFVAFLAADAKGTVAAYDTKEDLVNSRDFMLEQGGLTDETR